MRDSPDFDFEEELLLADPELEKPRFYKVVLLNDDYTPMDFVIDVLMQFFRKSYAEAETIMFNIHYQGSGICAIYPRDIAETKAEQVIEYARKHGHPLQCVIRPQ